MSEIPEQDLDTFTVHMHTRISKIIKSSTPMSLHPFVSPSNMIYLPPSFGLRFASATIV